MLNLDDARRFVGNSRDDAPLSVSARWVRQAIAELAAARAGNPVRGGIGLKPKAASKV